MKKIEPYHNLEEALHNLDNGGRFYNLFTKANDGQINQAELGKVGGIFNDKQHLILFLEMSLLKLSQADKADVISKLDSKLHKSYLKYKSNYLLPTEVESKSEIAQSTIMSGIPTLIDSKTEFSGFVMFPITSGDVTTFMMVPIMEEYDIYELWDDTKTAHCIVAHTKQETKLPESKVVIGGVVKEFNSDELGDGKKDTFLEVSYYI